MFFASIVALRPESPTFGEPPLSPSFVCLLGQRFQKFAQVGVEHDSARVQGRGLVAVVLDGSYSG